MPFKHLLSVKASALSASWYDIDEFSVVGATNSETHHSISLGKDSVVFANTRINACVESRATLPNDDATCRNNFAAESLYAQPFGL